MFERRTKVTAYTREQTLHWLTWLARSLLNINLSVFFVEWIQPDWLPSRAQRWLVFIVPVLLSGLGIGLLSGLGIGLLDGLASGLVYGLLFGLVTGLVVGGMTSVLDRITPAETLRWSWRKAQGGLVSILIRLLIFGLLLGLAAALVDKLVGDGDVGGPIYRFVDKLVSDLAVGMVGGIMISGLVSGLIYGLLLGLIVGLLNGLIKGLTTDRIATQTIPNEGIHRLLRNAMISFLAGGLVGAPVGGLGSGMASGGVSALLVHGLLMGISLGLLLGLKNGGLACLRHYILRTFLWCNGYAPWYYFRFLDYAAERVFLRKIGGGYVFTHGLLMQYFAMLEQRIRPAPS